MEDCYAATPIDHEMMQRRFTNADTGKTIDVWDTSGSDIGFSAPFTQTLASGINKVSGGHCETLVFAAPSVCSICSILCKFF